MKLEQSFEVAAPIDRVWEALTDVEQVAPCLPGAAITGRNDDGTFAGSFSVRIGPTSTSYTGKLSMESLDEPMHTATMRAHGTDKRGQGGADATIVSKLAAPAEGVTRVEVLTDYRITGRLARFGRGGMIEDISERLLRQFATNLQASLAADGPQLSQAGAGESPPEAEVARDGDQATGDPADPPPPREPIQGLSLAADVLLSRLRRNPAPLVGLAVLVALLRRRSARARAEPGNRARASRRSARRG
ncbi:MAG: SRPBCC family protein [Solirubrobacteraceae bacterium]